MSAPKPTNDASFVSATHDILFAPENAPNDAARCDVCNAVLAPDDDDECAPSGRGVFLSTRGTEVRREEVPLCSRCASAIGLSALSRSEIEEEEG